MTNQLPVNQPIQPQRKRGLQVTGIVVGGLLTLAPLFAMVRVVFSMKGAMADLQTAGAGDTGVLADHINSILNSTAIGLILCPVGIALLIVSLISFFKRCPRHSRASG